MKALTLKQPWPSLVADGHKTIETRSWATKYRGPLIVHASAKRPPNHVHWDVNDDLPPAINLVSMSRHWRWTEHRDDPQHGGVYRWVGPLGAIVATAQLVDCVPINPQAGHEHELYDPPDDHIYTTVDERALYRQQVVGDPSVASNVVATDLTDQLPYGDFSPGRFAWLLDDIKPTSERCPACRGRGLRLAFTDSDVPSRWGGTTHPCPVCDGAGHCDPIPAKGRERLWNWDPAVRSGTGSAD